MYMEYKDHNNKLQDELIELKSKYIDLNITLYIHDDVIKLESLLAKKTAVVGTGTAFMQEFVKIADKHKKVITLNLPHVGFGKNFDSSNQYKITSSVSRIRRFYSRFGFVSTHGKRTYRPDISGDMYRLPKKYLTF